MNVRVRLAPSPTGEPHIGTMRTAIFNWLLARHEGGRFVIRVEDTDQARYAPEAVDALFEAMRWLGMDWDEGPNVGGPHAPYVQSQRLALYLGAANRLIECDWAYRCYCTPERLEVMRRDQQAAKQPPRYDRRCRHLSPDQCRAHELEGDPSVVRFKVPESGETRVSDFLRGEIIFANSTQDDFVILKSDGFPTYHLAVVVDDHAMEITHVLRGEEWLPSFPKHVLLYAALDYPQPVFIHLPLILGKDHSKLSKRHGDTAVSAFRRDGFLPEAMFNFLGLLGWSLDDKTDILPREAFLEHFSLDRLVKSPAIYDVDKLKWMNGVYIRMLPLDVLTGHVAQRLEEELPPTIARPLDRRFVATIVPLIQERIKLLSEITNLIDFFFVSDPLNYPPSALLGKRFLADPAEACRTLSKTIPAAASVDPWSKAGLEDRIGRLAEELELKRGDLFGLIRVAITGKTVTPPLFESMEILGRARTLDRLEVALQRLS